MMTLDHFPDRIFAVIKKAQKQLEAGELTRFFSHSVLPQEPHPLADTHPMRFVRAPSSRPSSPNRTR
jgi:hypothetical protein